MQPLLTPTLHPDTILCQGSSHCSTKIYILLTSLQQQHAACDIFVIALLRMQFSLGQFRTVTSSYWNLTYVVLQKINNVNSQTNKKSDPAESELSTKAFSVLSNCAKMQKCFYLFQMKGLPLWTHDMQ